MSVSEQSEAVDRMCELFRGRQDAYGTAEGGCERASVPTNQGAPIAELAEQEYRRRMTLHLNGEKPMGVYPITVVPPVQPIESANEMAAHRFAVRWGCADLDYNDPTDALNIRTLGRAAGLDPWIERTRSGHWHVWFFASEWVPAATMRNALLALYQKLDIRAKEVNPKQVTLEAGQLGNYVRLPYPNYKAIATATQVMVEPEPHGHDGGASYSLDGFLTRVETRPASAYEAVAARYTPPPPPRTVKFSHAYVPYAGLVLPPLIRHIVEYGPGREITDRSDWLTYVAHCCRERDLTPDNAFAIVKEADDRWTRKFSDRSDGELRLTQMVERVYG